MPTEPPTPAPQSDGASRPYPKLALHTHEPTAFGYGWLSGLISAVLGLVGLGTVLCFTFPELTIPAARSLYPVEYIRAALHLVLITSFLFGTVSVFLRSNKVLGLVGIGATLVAALLGGSSVQIGEASVQIGEASVQIGEARVQTWLGLDWFVLDLMLYSAIFIPLERLFALKPEQPTFRAEWLVDVTYFFLNSILVQIIALVTMQPAMIFFDWARNDSVASFVGGLPLVVQVPLCLLAADFTQYWVHRAFHRIPMLWRFHAIHHSIETMDWLAGSRLHLVDAIVTRGLTYIPLYLLGFSQQCLVVYVIVVVIQATFIHANVRWQFPWIQRWIATPCFHHWHHAAEREAVDKNFAVHSPIWDWLFGTYYMPGRWPHQYGLCGTRDVPTNWLGQLIYPFKR